MTDDTIDNGEHAIAHELARWSDIITNDDGTPAAWADLVRRSSPHVPPTRPWYPHLSALSAFTPSLLPGYYQLPEDLQDEWTAYRQRWETFLERNPRCRIASSMSDISEAYDASSWPYGWEAEIAAWVRAGMPEPTDLPGVEHIRFPGWRAQLAAAAKKAGPGWVFYEDPGRYVWR